MATFSRRFILMMVFSAQLACFSPFTLYFYPLYSSYVAPCTPSPARLARNSYTYTLLLLFSLVSIYAILQFSDMQFDQRRFRRIKIDGCFTHQFRAFINRTVWEGFTCISIATLLTIFKYILIFCSYTYSEDYSWQKMFFKCIFRLFPRKKWSHAPPPPPPTSHVRRSRSLKI
jgi:hypothetical protein